jgi:hypothetical protein
MQSGVDELWRENWGSSEAHNYAGEVSRIIACSESPTVWVHRHKCVRGALHTRSDISSWRSGRQPTFVACGPIKFRTAEHCHRNASLKSRFQSTQSTTFFFYTFGIEGATVKYNGTVELTCSPRC